MDIYHIVYQITNLINNKIYVGVHTTSDLNDNYHGSGNLIKQAINKHGIKNFKREILFFCDSEKDMYNKESEIVNESFISRKDTYNLTIGGKIPPKINIAARKIACSCGCNKDYNPANLNRHLYGLSKSNKEKILLTNRTRIRTPEERKRSSDNAKKHKLGGNSILVWCICCKKEHNIGNFYKHIKRN